MYLLHVVRVAGARNIARARKSVSAIVVANYVAMLSRDILLTCETLTLH